MSKFIYIVLFIVTGFSVSSVAGSNTTECLMQCHLNVYNQEITYLTFARAVNNGANRVIYFDILHDKYYNVNATLYAWVRDNVGEPVFSLPIDYIATSFGLPMVFIDYVSVNLTESSPNCYHQASQFCQKIMIMSALVKMTKLDNRCNGTNCGSLCRRHFHFRDRGDLERNTFSCCPEESLEKEVDLVKCLQPQQLKPYISILGSLTIFIGSLISCAALVWMANRIFCSLGSTIPVENDDPLDEMDDNQAINRRRVFILSPITKQTSVYNYFKYLMAKSRSQRRWHYICYTMIGIAAIICASLSLTIQSYPLPFVKGLKLVALEVPWTIIVFAILLIGYYIFSIFIIRSYLSYSQNNPSARQFRYNSYHVRSYHPPSILNSIDLWHPMQFISQFIRIHMFHDNPSLSNINQYKLIFIISWTHAIITMAAIFISFQCVFRMLISASAFIVAYSLYFSNIITITIPFIYYIYITIDEYNNRIDQLLTDITEILPSVDSEVDHLLRADEGEVEIYFTIIQAHLPTGFARSNSNIESENKRVEPSTEPSHKEMHVIDPEAQVSPILSDSDNDSYMASDETNQLLDQTQSEYLLEDIDVPEMLLSYQGQIKRQLQDIFDTCNVRFDKGTYKILVHYIRDETRTIRVDLPAWNDHHLYQLATQDLQPLADQLQPYIQIALDNIGEHKKNLTKVYYRLGRIDEVDCIGIPTELYYWIRYYSPKLSFTYWSVIWKIAISSGIYAAILLAIPAYARIDKFADFNAAITKLPVSLVTIIIALKCFQESVIDQAQARKMILSHLIRYVRGYKFFYQQANRPGIFQQFRDNYLPFLTRVSSRKLRHYVRLPFRAPEDNLL